MLPAILLAATLATPTAPVKVLVLRTHVERNVAADLAAPVTELALNALSRAHGASVSGEDDLLPFLDDAGRKQLRDCRDDAACIVEIGGAIGSEYLVSLSIGAIEGQLLLSGRVLVARDGSVAARSGRTLAKGEGLAKEVCPLVAELLTMTARNEPRLAGNEAICAAETTPVAATVTLPVPDRSRTPQVLLGLGAAAIVGGLVAGGFGLANHQEASRLAAAGDAGFTIPREAARWQLLTGDVLGLAGLVLAGSGAWLWSEAK